MQAAFKFEYELAPISDKSEGLYVGIEVLCEVSFSAFRQGGDLIVMVDTATPEKVAVVFGDCLLKKKLTDFGETEWKDVRGELRAEIEKRCKSLSLEALEVTEAEALEEIRDIEEDYKYKAAHAAGRI